MRYFFWRVYNNIFDKILLQTSSDNIIHLGIEFYLFFSNGGMNDRGSMCKFRNAQSAFRKCTRRSSVNHNSMRNKQLEFNPYIYTLSKLSHFSYEISVFKYTTGRYSEQPPEQPAHTPRLSLHGKMDVKIFS